MDVKPLKFFDPPPVRYMGSKWQLADWIIELMPPHKIYVEPYCGGASVFFRKQPSKIECLNDINGDVVNFFDVLRSKTEEFIRQIEFTPFSREEYDRAFEPADDPMERARRFYIRSWQAFGSGGLEKKTGWRRQYNTHRGTYVTREWQRMTGLWLGAQRLRDAQIESDDAAKVIHRYDAEDTLYYVDPPYLLSSRERKIKRYSHEMTEQDHRDLAIVLNETKGMVLLSGYDSELYRSLYPDWRVVSKSNTTNGNSTSMEYLWISPNADRLSNLPLFK